MMADLGPCMGDTLPSTLNIWINEVSTAAAAYALSGWMTGPTAIGFDNTTAGATGFTNASANVNQLVGLSTGAALTATPNGYGTPPTAALLTLANILGACVNTNGSTATGSACGTLFANATADGTPTGTRPTDSLTAALNIAHHPAANVANLYALTAATLAFSGGLATQPNDFTLAIAFNGGGTGVMSPGVPAVDASGNVWFASTAPDATAFSISDYAVAEFSPLGAPINTTLTQIGVPGIQTAVDPSGNAWIATTSGGKVIKVVGNLPTGYAFNGTSNDDGHQIAIDPSGNVYISDNTNGNVYEISSSGTMVGNTNFTTGGSGTPGYHEVALLNASTVLFVYEGNAINAESPLQIPASTCGSDEGCRFGGLSAPSALAVDGAANVWALNSNSTLSGFASNGNNNPGSAISNSPFSGGGLNTATTSPKQPYPWLTIDGSSNVWVANYTGGLSEFSTTGAALSPAFVSTSQPGGFYGASPNCKGQGAAVDNAGNVWVSCDSSTTPFIEYIGLATPVYTPITPGHLGVKP